MWRHLRDAETRVGHGTMKALAFFSWDCACCAGGMDAKLDPRIRNGSDYAEVVSDWQGRSVAGRSGGDCHKIITIFSSLRKAHVSRS